MDIRTEIDMVKVVVLVGCAMYSGLIGSALAFQGLLGECAFLVSSHSQS